MKYASTIQMIYPLNNIQMKKMNQSQLRTVADDHKKALFNGAMIIQLLSMVMLIVCLVGIFTDTAHCEAYCVAFTFASVTALFGILMYDKHKRDFK